MACMGDAIETWLNLLCGNGGLFNLLLNLATGNSSEGPNILSATFKSILGNTDTRVELDQNIKPSDRKYKASLCIMASKISYENEAFIKTTITKLWKMKFVKFYNFVNDFREPNLTKTSIDAQDTQAFILQDTQANPNLFVVAFRGTSPFDAGDWRTDADLCWCQLKGMGNSKTHSGFMQALGLQRNKGWPEHIEQGFILPYLHGPESRLQGRLDFNIVEGNWIVRLPGVSAHSPQDYVNSIRLGDLPLDLELQVKGD